MNRMTNLKYILENELFITCPFLSTDQFISYCRERGIQTSREQLEQFEKLEIFYPIVRIQYLKIKIKIEYLDNGKSYRDLGVLRDGELWSGDIKEGYADFWFDKEYAKNWFEEGLLWEASSRPFQAWETFQDENGHRQIESFYSVFQCYTFYNLIRSTRMEIRLEEWVSYSKEQISRQTSFISDRAKMEINYHQVNGIKEELAPVICQIISNRYYPKTQSDRRTWQLSVPTHYHNWDWDEYRRNWNAQAVLANAGINIDELKQLHETIVSDARFVDPLERWYELVRFVSVGQKKRLKHKALFAQTLYSMEQMLRQFYEELTGDKLYPPDESPDWQKINYYGKGITQDELRYLEFLTNQYHLNPKPKLIFVVEGDGEEEQFPQVARKLFGCSFEKLGIQVQNLKGIGQFEGKKGIDRCGALERFIDDHHNRQTIVFVVLDNEGRASNIKNNLIQAHSKYYSGRKITKEEYIHIWNKTIEFDNFSHEEIARAMTEICERRYEFTIDEIVKCEKSCDGKTGNPLSKFFEEKIGRGLPKKELLKILFRFITSYPNKEFSDDAEAKRPVVRIIEKIIELATLNHQPVTLDDWNENQGSGYLGDVVE